MITAIQRAARVLQSTVQPVRRTRAIRPLVRPARHIIKVYTDPALAWGCIKLSELARVGIAARISGTSKVRGASVYLDVDCGDLQRYQDALRAMREEWREEYRVMARTSPIRGYPAYQPTTQGA